MREQGKFYHGCGVARIKHVDQAGTVGSWWNILLTFYCWTIFFNFKCLNGWIIWGGERGGEREGERGGGKGGGVVKSKEERGSEVVGGCLGWGITKTRNTHTHIHTHTYTHTHTYIYIYIYEFSPRYKQKGFDANISKNPVSHFLLSRTTPIQTNRYNPDCFKC